MKQAREFGIKNIVNDPDSAEFLTGQSILVNTVDKLFNGLSQFKLRAQSIPVGTLLLDDAHACADSIREAFTISLPRTHDCYTPILDLFNDELEVQGPGTLAEIRNGNFEALLPIPYWAWHQKYQDVTRFLAKRLEDNRIKFPWALIKDELAECQCVISGGGVEIAPRLPLLEMFGSYWKAQHRIFMSATITNDAFLIKGLNIAPSAITNPLTYAGEKWYGEKMVLIPSLTDESLTREKMVSHFGLSGNRRLGGYVALTPSFKKQTDWSKAGAEPINKNNIDVGIQRLYERDFARTLVLVNKYDGIDLPDDTCRVLVIDGKPFAEGLLDRYQDGCRATSEATLLKQARTIEQGMGRAVRGQRDYCVVILAGTSLVRAMRTGHAKAHFSNMTHKQIDIGLTVAQLAKEEIHDGAEPLMVIDKLIKQCLERDEGWKEFYTQEMDTLEVKVTSPAMLEFFSAELRAERLFQSGSPDGAISELQDLIDQHIDSNNREDRGWYLQEMARYKFPTSATESNDLQIQAHKINRSLMRPKTGMIVEKLVVNQVRVENIRTWIAQFEGTEALLLAVDEICANLTFGRHADAFEGALHEMGVALGFACQRPDKEWREGPDNLWALRDAHYLLFECKSEVDSSRDVIYKAETGQMNNSCAWFKQYYPGSVVMRILIIPTKTLGPGAGFNESVEIMRKGKLKSLVANFKRFFQDFKQLDLKNIPDSRIQKAIEEHSLGLDSLLGRYSESPLLD